MSRKDYMNMKALVELASTTPGQKVLVIGKGISVRDLFRYIIESAHQSSVARVKFADRKISFNNGSSIHVMPPEPDRMRGTMFTRVWIDEGVTQPKRRKIAECLPGIPVAPLIRVIDDFGNMPPDAWQRQYPSLST